MVDAISEPNASAPTTSIPEISRGQLRSARRLLQARGRAASGDFLAEGSQAVREALRVLGTVKLLVVDDPVKHANLVQMADGLPVVAACADDVAALTDTVTAQGVFAVCHQASPSLDDLTNPRLVVICAQVRDPGNAGTVVRCADAFGADAVILTTGSVDLYNPKTVRASVGSVFHLPVVTDVPFDRAVEWAHAQGLQVLAADASGQCLDELDNQGVLAAPTAWVMGNEAWGLPEQQLALSDRVVSVPMWGQAESLNLSTAAAVCLYASASAQRRPH